MKVRVLTKKGRLKEALAASMKKVNLIEDLEDELLQQVEIGFDESYYDIYWYDDIMIKAFSSFPGLFLISAS